MSKRDLIVKLGIRNANGLSITKIIDATPNPPRSKKEADVTQELIQVNQVHHNAVLLTALQNNQAAKKIQIPVKAVLSIDISEKKIKNTQKNINHRKRPKRQSLKKNQKTKGKRTRKRRRKKPVKMKLTVQADQTLYLSIKLRK